MKMSELVKVNCGKYATVNPFLLQHIQESKLSKKKCNCNICGEPLEDVGEVSYIDAYLIGYKEKRRVKFTCVRKMNNFLQNLINHYGWSPKTEITLNDIGPNGELVQYFQCEFWHMLES